ncbi:hypothetical protein MNBD_GAMMA24-928 [hydrothermal vent metagenome]|uniref:Sulphotransferase Stf0 domain-containing protein n=1 Tax=hydrothermal vent metagenome TaxID=652676 RepID=A0A3B1C9V8_9ZZZZ
MRIPKGKVDVGDSGYFTSMQSSSWRKIGHYLWRGVLVRRHLDELYATTGCQAVGFKFMYNHLRRFPMVLPYLNRHEVRVIHVVRENAFKTLLSQLVAEARGLYHSDRPTEMMQIRVPIEGLTDKLQRIQSEGMRWAEIFAGSKHYLKVSYESFLSQMDVEARRMMALLDVDYAPLTSPLVKVNTDDPSRTVENYDEVRDCLARTPFAWCLAEK